MNRVRAVLAIDKLMVDGGRGENEELRLQLVRVEQDALVAALYRRLRARGVEAPAARTQASALSVECLVTSGLDIGAALKTVAA